MASKTQSAEQLSDDLGEYSIEQSEDGIRATVTDITSHRKASDTIQMTAELPDGIEVTEEFEKPRLWDDSNKFVRIVTAQGYDASSLHFLVGERVPVTQNRDEDWVFHDPVVDASQGAFQVAKIQAMGIAGWVAVGVLGWLLFSGLAAFGPPAVAAVFILEILSARSA